MEIVEKVNLTTGTGWESDLCVGNTASVPRFNIPALCLQDGPLGVRFADFISAFPAGISAGTTFNKDLISFRARAMAGEHKTKGVNVVLGPVVGGLGRNALGGRNWEGFGADPYLQGVAARLTTREIQKAGLIATVKHYIGNEQEHFRQVGEYYGYNEGHERSLSSNIDDRTLHEIYLWPFADCVNEGVGSIMCSYNQINNTYGCENSYLLNKVLKEELGFQGFVMADWWATKTGVTSAKAGLDMNMPGDTYIYHTPGTLWGNKLAQAVLNGTLPEWRLDDMATRILATYFYVGLENGKYEPNFSSWTKDTWGYRHQAAQADWAIVNQHVDANHNAISRSAAAQVATEAVVLLKNRNGILPFVTGSFKPRKINIFGLAAGPDPRGPNCKPDMACSGGALGEGWGSGAVNFPYFTTPFEAVSERAKRLLIDVDYDFTSWDFSGFDSKVAHSDVNIIFALANSGEGCGNFDGNWGDRRNASLWHNADEVILRAAKNNVNNVVVISTVGPVNVEKWIDHPNIKAVLLASPGGQDAGLAISSILFGKTNPSGKLPYTIAKNDKDYIPVMTEFSKTPQANFDEGIYIDYRYFDKYNLDPRFEFGYGLSYSNFTLNGISVQTLSVPSENLPKAPPLQPVSNYTKPCNRNTNPSAYLFPPGFPKVHRYIYPWFETADEIGNITSTCSPITDAITEAPIAGGGLGGNPALWDPVYDVKVTASNQGPYPGSYAFQLYVSFPKESKYDTPPRQLRGFEKPYLEVGKSTNLTFRLLRRDLSVWDSALQSWVVPRGKYKFWVGNSSRDFLESIEVDIS